jgi:Tol biopolymer transport system component
MKAIYTFFFLLLVNLGFAQSIPIDSLYLGQIPPGDSAIIFAPGTLSLTNRRETKIVSSPDGRECLIGIGIGGTFKILYSNYENENWTEPKQADFITNDRAKEPFFSPDGQEIFFTSHADIFVSTLLNQQWTTPVKLDSPINTMAEEYHPTSTLDRTLYFCSMRENPNGYIYRASYENGNYMTVEKLDTIINTHYGAWDPYISPDESYIIFTTVHPDGYGQEDQYISYNRNGTWTNPKNLGALINTDKIEYGSYISPDNKYYFFSRPDGWGADIPADIYWIKADFVDPLRKSNDIIK